MSDPICRRVRRVCCGGKEKARSGVCNRGLQEGETCSLARPLRLRTIRVIPLWAGVSCGALATSLFNCRPCKNRNSAGAGRPRNSMLRSKAATLFRGGLSRSTRIPSPVGPSDRKPGTQRPGFLRYYGRPRNSAALEKQQRFFVVVKGDEIIVTSATPVSEPLEAERSPVSTP